MIRRKQPSAKKPVKKPTAKRPATKNALVAKQRILRQVGAINFVKEALGDGMAINLAEMIHAKILDAQLFSVPGKGYRFMLDFATSKDENVTYRIRQTPNAIEIEYFRAPKVKPVEKKTTRNITFPVAEDPRNWVQTFPRTAQGLEAALETTLQKAARELGTKRKG